MGVGQAQQYPTKKSLEFPKTILLSWQLLEIEPAIKALTNNQIKEAHQQLANAVLGENQSFEQYLQTSREMLPGVRLLNSNRFNRRIKISKARTKDFNSIKILQPVWCNLADYSVFILTETNSRNEWTNISLSAIKKKSIDMLKKPNPGSMVARIPTDNLIQQFQKNTDSTIGRDHLLKFNLRARNTLNHQKITSDACLTMMIASKMLKQSRIIASLGTEESIYVLKTFDLNHKLGRSNRYLGIKWYTPIGTKSATLPLSIKSKYSIAESIFGGSVPFSHEETLTFKEENGILNFSFPEKIERWIKKEHEMMNSTQTPTVVSIYGAWAYLNVGRSYGVRIRDRMVSINSNKIKGHIIGFYGPELKIKNESGERITEGAILFVRKGQKTIKVGDTLKFDATSFPTPWPPKSKNPG